MLSSFQITICGGGNLSHASVACIGHHNPNIKINVLTRKPSEWKPKMVGITEGSLWEYKGKKIEGHINKCSSNPEEVIPGSKIILVCGPAHIHGVLLETIKDFIDDGAFVGTVYGQGSFDLQARYVLKNRIEEKHLTIFALLNVPFICKVQKYGELVKIIGPKNFLYCATYPTENVHIVSNFIALLYYIPTIPLANFLSITLTPSNQIIHPGRLFAVFSDWDGKKTYEASKVPRLYDDLDDASAEQIQLLDDEIQAIKRAVLQKYPQIDLSYVMPIKERIIMQYKEQITDPSTLKSVFNTNNGYKGLSFPVKKITEDRVIPLPESRFFWEDIPYGLCILKNIGDLFGVPMKNTERLIKWHQQFMGVEFLNEKNELNENVLDKTGAAGRYDIKTAYDLVQTSLPKKPTIIARL